jgi:arsenite methyltransferase
LLEEAGFVDIKIGPAVDTFGGSSGEKKARTIEVYAYPFLAVKPE